MSDDKDKLSNTEKQIVFGFFKLHAIQRIRLFRYYLFLIAALYASYFYILANLDKCSINDLPYHTILDYSRYVCAGAIIIVSLLFRSIDKRNVELINNAKHRLNLIDDKDESQLSYNDKLRAKRHYDLFNYGFITTLVSGIIFLFLPCCIDKYIYSCRATTVAHKLYPLNNLNVELPCPLCNNK